MTSYFDLLIATAMILEEPEPANVERWIYGTHFKQLLDAIKVFRNYYAERKAQWSIPQSLLDELDALIIQFPTLTYHYTIKAADQNVMVDALYAIGRLVQYGKPVIKVCYVKRMKIHWLNPDGSVKQTFDYYANQKPKVPHWIDGVDYPDGNVKVETVWWTNFVQSVRSDIRAKLLWSMTYQDRINGQCVTPTPNTDFSIFNFFRMPSENISLECYLMDCDSGGNYNFIPIPIEVTDVSPPPPMTASIEGTIKGWNPAMFPLPPNEGPLKDVKISVGALSTLTNASGYYKITGIPVGYHTWAAFKVGWREIKVGEEYRSGEAKHRDAVIVPA